eukprot:Sspe_Gene.114254::Locus_99745_Transcript_1_1_Confidence_1.000_Length_786::g.114254::m.114254/K12898/HNRNPF_H; heterogeneous nuclear ribonucleoprotein F/H
MSNDDGDQAAGSASGSQQEQQSPTGYQSPVTTKQVESPTQSSTDDVVLKLQGLPFRASEEEIRQFVEENGIEVLNGEVTIQIGYDGRPTGRAFITVKREDAQRAVAELDRKTMGKRYVEVLESSEIELRGAKGGGIGSPDEVPNTTIVRLRGLPYSATEHDISVFLTDDVRVKPDGIHLVLYNGRPSGEAYVEVETVDDVVKALKRHNEHIESRYIEVFRSSSIEMRGALEFGGSSGKG